MSTHVPHVPETLLQSKATRKATRDALAELEGLRERDRLQVRAIADAERALESAETREVQDAAKALRAGKEMPATALDEQRAALEAMRREGQALELAMEASATAAEDAIRENRAAWQQQHDGVTERRRSELLAALDAFEAAEDATRTALAVDGWLAGRAPLRVGPMPALARINGEKFSAAELVAELRAYAAGDDPGAERAKAEAQEAEAAANAGRADREAEMVRQHIANGGSYSDPLYLIQDRYADRGAVRAA